MMTKKQYCMAILKPFLKEYNTKDPKKLIPYVYSSTKMGVALQELGYLNKIEYPAEYEYISSRAGIAEMTVDDPYVNENSVHILTIRDIINLLPDKLDKEKSETF